MLQINSQIGGVSPKGRHRIQYDFMLDGARYRPTLPRIPTEANLRRAQAHLEDIKSRIRNGTFVFEEEFPDYRYMERVIDPSQIRTCNQVFDQFLEHCEARLARHDLAASTLFNYRRIIDNLWRPELGEKLFLKIDHLTLNRIADRNKRWSKKRYNNAISALRRAFAFGYRNHPEKPNPALGLKCCRMTRKDRLRPDPFRIQDAEKLIAQIRSDWGEAQANYDEFRFFTGLRPSEQLALVVSDFDPVRSTLSITKARVNGVDKNSTKTGHDRLFELCPRARAVLARHLRLRARLVAQGRITHDRLFFHKDGEPIQNLAAVERRWRVSLRRAGIRHRRPYMAPLERQLESHARKKPDGGRPATRTQRAHDARGLRRLGGRGGCLGRRGDRAGHGKESAVRRSALEHPAALHARNADRYSGESAPIQRLALDLPPEKGAMQLSD